MNFNWLTLIGGGFTAAATLTAGISMSGLMAPSDVPAVVAPAAETVYVEQPIIEIAPLTPGASQLPPRIIAILPPDAATGTGGVGAGTALTTPTPGSVSTDPVLPPSYSGDEDDESYEDSDDGYASGDDEDEDEDEDEGEYVGGGDDD